MNVPAAFILGNPSLQCEWLKISINYHVGGMLKLVESLAAKITRAKSTTVVFEPLGDSVSHRCSWCGQFAKGGAKGWNGYRAMDHANSPQGLAVVGDVCSNKECRISIQAKYTKSP
jgi:hypothetical protein